MDRNEAIKAWFDRPVQKIDLLDQRDYGVANYRIEFTNEVSDWRIYFDAETGAVLEAYSYQTIMEF